MDKKVMISYTTNLSSIPMECSDLIDRKIRINDIVDKMDNIQEYLKNTDRVELDVIPSMLEIESLRKVLTEYDSLLGEVFNILSGIRQIKESESQEAQEEVSSAQPVEQA